MKLRYFAWIREKIGHEEEDIIVPETVITVADLIDFLRNRGENYANALAQQTTIHVALDHNHAEHSDKLHNVREVALFPPMTGG